MSETSDLKINVGEVLRQRIPSKSRYIPRFVVKWLERFIRQDEMNSLLSDTAGLRGADFCHGVLRHLGITYRVEGRENIPSGADSRVVFVCNHPLGGLDGITLIHLITQATGMEVRFLVNDLLMAVKPLSDVFLPINKHGRQSRQAAVDVAEAFRSPLPIIIFPAGLVSRKGKNGVVADLQWQKTFVNMCVKYGRDIIPVHFNGRNSTFFYNFANLRVRLGLRFNIEMLRLPAELMRCRDTEFTVTVGKRIPVERFKGGPAAQQEADALRKIVYNLNQQSPK